INKLKQIKITKMNTTNNVIGFLQGILYTVFVFLDINTSVFFILLLFMIFDSLTGVIKVLRINKEKFSFKILMWGIVSKIGLLIIPLLVALLFKGIGGQYINESGDVAEGLKLGIMSVDIIMKILIVSEFMSLIG